MTKLTLSVEETVVKEAKRIAQANRTSVSAMFTQFVKSMAGRTRRPIPIGPLTRKLSGIMELPPGKTYEDVLTDALMDKHGIAK